MLCIYELGHEITNSELTVHPNGEDLHVKTIVSKAFFLAALVYIGPLKIAFMSTHYYTTHMAVLVNIVLQLLWNGVYTVNDIYRIPTKYTCQAIYMYTLFCYIRLF